MVAICSSFSADHQLIILLLNVLLLLENQTIVYCHPVSQEGFESSANSSEDEKKPLETGLKSLNIETLRNINAKDFIKATVNSSQTTNAFSDSFSNNTTSKVFDTLKNISTSNAWEKFLTHFSEESSWWKIINSISNISLFSVTNNRNFVTTFILSSIRRLIRRVCQQQNNVFCSSITKEAHFVFRNSSKSSSGRWTPGNRSANARSPPTTTLSSSKDVASEIFRSFSSVMNDAVSSIVSGVESGLNGIGNGISVVTDAMVGTVMRNVSLRGLIVFLVPSIILFIALADLALIPFPIAALLAFFTPILYGAFYT